MPSSAGGNGKRLTVEYRPLEALIPHARNARTHSDAQVADIAASIHAFGWTNPILVDGENELIRVAHNKNNVGIWQLSIAEFTPLGTGVPSGGAVTSVAPAYNGTVRYATAGGTVGIDDTTNKVVKTVALQAGERISNSIAT